MAKKNNQINVEETGKLLQVQFEHKGMDVNQIKEELGIESVQTIYNWFNGKSLPSLDNFIKLSDLLAIPIDRLIVKEEEYCKTEQGYKLFISKDDMPEEDFRRLGEICLQTGVPFHDLLEIYCRGFLFYETGALIEEGENIGFLN